MPTNYERLTILEDDTNAFTSTTSMVPLHIEEDDLKPPGPLSRLQALGRIPLVALYFLALGLGIITSAFALIRFLNIEPSALRGAITMDDVFDGSLSPQRHMIEWLPQCEFRPNIASWPQNEMIPLLGGDDAYGIIRGGNLVLFRSSINSSEVLLSKYDLVDVSCTPPAQSMYYCYSPP